MPGDPNLRQTTSTTWLHTRGYAQSSELTPRAIFVLQVAKTTDWEAFTSMFHTASQKKNEYDYPGSNKFSDEGGSASKGNLIYYIYQDSEAEARRTGFAKTQPKV